MKIHSTCEIEDFVEDVCDTPITRITGGVWCAVLCTTCSSSSRRLWSCGRVLQEQIFGPSEGLWRYVPGADGLVLSRGDAFEGRKSLANLTA